MQSEVVANQMVGILTDKFGEGSVKRKSKFVFQVTMQDISNHEILYLNQLIKEDMQITISKAPKGILITILL